jgi:hypothetical protein
MDANRRPFADIVAGLSTKADKIRALSRAGYERSEIAALLNVRYQNVRKALIDAGASQPKQAPAASLRMDAPKKDAPAGAHSWEVLLQAGFIFIGEWLLGNDGVISLGATIPVDAGVYAFVVDDIVKYIGATRRGLRHRLRRLNSSFTRKNSSARLEILIAETLDSGRRVKVLVAAPQPLDWKGLPVDTSAGLEAGLVAMMRPEWNLRTNS